MPAFASESKSVCPSKASPATKIDIVNPIPPKTAAAGIIRHVTPVAAMSPAFLIPVFGVTWGHLFLGEALSPGIFAGGALVLLATALVTGFNPLRRWWAATPAP